MVFSFQETADFLALAAMVYLMWPTNIRKYFAEPSMSLLADMDGEMHVDVAEEDTDNPFAVNPGASDL